MCVTIYTAPSGNFNLYVAKLDIILRNLHTSALEYIICSDINLNYLTDSERKSQLEALLQIYNVTSTVNFPTSVQNNLTTAIDNMFTDITNTGSCSVCPIINGFSDHDGQSIMFITITLKPHIKQFIAIRKRNQYTIHDFLTKLSYETSDITFPSDDVNTMFNSYLNTYFRIFYSSFPLKKKYPH